MNSDAQLQERLSALYLEVADFFASSPSAEQILELRPSEASEHLISELLEANRTRGLTPAENAILDDYSHVEHLIQLIKVRAAVRISQSG